MMGCGMATADRCYGLLPHDGSRPTYLHEVILGVIPKFKLYGLVDISLRYDTCY